MLFDAHQVITANGVATESYLPGAQTLTGFDADVQAEIEAIFPHLAHDTDSYGPAARPILRSYEAAPLVHALAA